MLVELTGRRRRELLSASARHWRLVTRGGSEGAHDLWEILVAARDMMLLDLIEKSIMISQTTLVSCEYFETFDAHGYG